MRILNPDEDKALNEYGQGSWVDQSVVKPVVSIYRHNYHPAPSTGPKNVVPKKRKRRVLPVEENIQISKPKRINLGKEIPFFRRKKLKKLRKGNFYMHQTVEKLIKICGGNCLQVKQNMDNRILHKMHYLSQGGENVLTNGEIPILPRRGLQDLELVQQSRTIAPGISATVNDWHKSILQDLRNPEGAKMKTNHTTPMLMVAGRDMEMVVQPLAAGSITHIQTATRETSRTKNGPAENLALITPKGRKAFCSKNYAAAKQNMAMMLQSNERFWLQKAKNSRQIMIGTVEEAFHIQHLITKTENPYLRRLVAQNFPDIERHPHMGLTFNFYSGVDWTTLNGNYASQMRSFIKFVNERIIERMGKRARVFDSIASFVFYLTIERNRVQIGTFISRYMRERVQQAASKSTNNWWSAIAWCYTVQGTKLANYTPKIGRKTLVRAFHIPSDPTDGLYVPEWTNFIAWCYQGPPAQKLLGIFMVYMMRLGMRANTLAKLHMNGPILVWDRTNEIFCIHQWATEQKNVKAYKGHLPSFTMVKAEERNKMSPFICPIWAYEQIQFFREKLRVKHQYFLFDINGNPYAPRAFGETVVRTLVAWKKHHVDYFPHLQALKMGRHTPRRTLSNVATWFGIPELQIKMIMRNKSLEVIRNHYTQTSRAYHESQTWNTHMRCRSMTEAQMKKVINKWSKVPTPKELKNFYALKEFFEEDSE